MKHILALVSLLLTATTATLAHAGATVMVSTNAGIAGTVVYPTNFLSANDIDSVAAAKVREAAVSNLVVASTNTIAAASLVGTINVARLSGITSNQMDGLTDAAYRGGGGTSTSDVHQIINAWAITGTVAIATNLNATQLLAGTVPLARLSGITSNQMDAATDAAYRHTGVLTNETDPVFAVWRDGDSILLGAAAGLDSSMGYFTAIGIGAGWNTGIGEYGTAIGSMSANSAAGSYWTALGDAAGSSAQGDQWTAIGSMAGYGGSGMRWTAIGPAAGYLVSGDSWTAIGPIAGQNAIGTNNVYIGQWAGRAANTNNTIFIDVATNEMDAINNSIVIDGNGRGIVYLGRTNGVVQLRGTVRGAIPAFTSAWALVYSDGATNKQEKQVGAAGSYLRSAGLGAAPTWEFVSATATNVALSNLVDVATNTWMPVGNGSYMVMRSPAFIRTNLNLVAGVNIMPYGTNFLYDTQAVNAATLQGYGASAFFQVSGAAALTGNGNAGGYRWTNMANGIDAQDAATIGQIVAATGSIDAATLTGTIPLARLSGITSNQLATTERDLLAAAVNRTITNGLDTYTAATNREQAIAITIPSTNGLDTVAARQSAITAATNTIAAESLSGTVSLACLAGITSNQLAATERDLLAASVNRTITNGLDTYTSATNREQAITASIPSTNGLDTVAARQSAISVAVTVATNTIAAESLSGTISLSRLSGITSNQIAAATDEAYRGANAVTNGGATVNGQAIANGASIVVAAFTSQWSVLYSDAATNAVVVPLGAPNTYLRSVGASSPPVFDVMTVTATNLPPGSVVVTNSGTIGQFIQYQSGTVDGVVTARFASATGTGDFLSDGTIAMTANLNHGGYRATNLAAGVAATDAVNLSQLQSATSTLVKASITNGLDSYVAATNREQVIVATIPSTNGLDTVTARQSAITAATNTIAAESLSGTISVARLSGITSNQLAATERDLLAAAVNRSITNGLDSYAAAIVRESAISSSIQSTNGLAPVAYVDAATNTLRVWVSANAGTDGAAVTGIVGSIMATGTVYNATHFNGAAASSFLTNGQSGVTFGNLTARDIMTLGGVPRTNWYTASGIATATTSRAFGPSAKWTDVTMSTNGQWIGAVALGNNVWATMDAGTNIFSLDPGYPFYQNTFRSIASSWEGRNLVIAGNSFVALSTNYGTSWVLQNHGSLLMHTPVSDRTGKYLALGAKGTGSSFPRRSIDGGTNWLSYPTNMLTRVQVGCSSEDGQFVAFGGGNCDNEGLDSLNTEYIYVSTNAGTNYTRTASNRNWKGIACDTSGSNLVAAAHSNYVWISSDSGTTWIPRIDVRFWRQVAMAKRGGMCWAVASNDYVYMSGDYGTNWAPLTELGVKPWAVVACDETGRKAVVGATGQQLQYIEYNAPIGGSVPYAESAGVATLAGTALSVAFPNVTGDPTGNVALTSWVTSLVITNEPAWTAAEPFVPKVNAPANIYNVDSRQYFAIAYVTNNANANEPWGVVNYETMTNHFSADLRSVCEKGNTYTGEIYVGRYAGIDGSVAIGSSALDNENNPWELGYGNNVAIGQFAMQSSSSSLWNTAVGNTAMGEAFECVGNFAFGPAAMFQTSFSDLNYVSGFQSARASSYLYRNIAMGEEALSESFNCADNLAVSVNAMRLSDSCMQNIVLGRSSMQNSYSSSNNVVIGGNAAVGASECYNNSVFGEGAMSYMTNSSGCVAIGPWAGRGAVGYTNGLFIDVGHTNDPGPAHDVTDCIVYSTGGSLYLGRTNGAINHLRGIWEGIDTNMGMRVSELEATAVATSNTIDVVTNAVVGLSNAVISATNSIAAESIVGVIPLASLSGITSNQMDAATDAAYRSSGGAELVAATNRVRSLESGVLELTNTVAVCVTNGQDSVTFSGTNTLGVLARTAFLGGLDANLIGPYMRLGMDGFGSYKWRYPAPDSPEVVGIDPGGLYGKFATMTGANLRVTETLRVDGSLYADGICLTNLYASQLTYGTVPLARLSGITTNEMAATERDKIAAAMTNTSLELARQGGDLLAGPFRVGVTNDPTAPAAGEGIKIWVSETNGKQNLNIMGSDGIKNRIMRDLVSTVRNTTGSDIPAGKAVYASGALGTSPNVGLAKADNVTTLPAIGVTMETITAGGYGRIQRFGRTEFTWNTSAYTVNDELFVSATTAGEMTTNRPGHPNFAQSIGSVVVSGVGNGSVFVNFGSYYNGHSAGTVSTSWIFGASALTNQVLVSSATAVRTASFPDVSGSVLLDTSPLWIAVSNQAANAVTNGATVTNSLQLAGVAASAFLTNNGPVIASINAGLLTLTNSIVDPCHTISNLDGYTSGTVWVTRAAGEYQRIVATNNITIAIDQSSFPANAMCGVYLGISNGAYTVTFNPTTISTNSGTAYPRGSGGVTLTNAESVVLLERVYGSTNKVWGILQME